MPETGSDARAVCQRVMLAAGEALAAFACPGLGASVGLVTFAEAPVSVEEMLRQADSAMYFAKRHAKGSVHVVRGVGRASAD